MIRLLTYNTHGGIGRFGHPDPGPLLEVIDASRADVVALQEVHDDEIDGLRFLDALRELGFAAVVHGPTLTKRRGAYGNVLMSRVPPTEVEHIDLGGIEPRAAIRFHLELADGPLDVCGTHLGLSGGERLRQIRRLDEILAGADERHGDRLQVLMGDLNEWRPRTRFMAALRRRFGRVSRLRTFPARYPVIALDRIALRGEVKSVRFRRMDAPPADRASDHRPLLVEVEVAG